MKKQRTNTGLVEEEEEAYGYRNSSSHNHPISGIGNDGNYYNDDVEEEVAINNCATERQSDSAPDLYGDGGGDAIDYCDNDDNERENEVSSLAEEQPPCVYHDKHGVEEEVEEDEDEDEDADDIQSEIELPMHMKLGANATANSHSHSSHHSHAINNNFIANANANSNVSVPLQVPAQFVGNPQQQQLLQQQQHNQQQQFAFQPPQHQTQMNYLYAQQPQPQPQQHFPPQLPMQMSMPMQMPLPMSPVPAFNSSNNNMLFQEVQYYESKMRDHAAAYASAAAGAAWAAAQIATGATNVTPASPPFQGMNFINQHQHQYNHPSASVPHQNVITTNHILNKLTKKQKRSSNNNNSSTNNHHNHQEPYQNVATSFTANQSQHRNYLQQRSGHYQQNKRSRYRHDFSSNNSHNNSNNNNNNSNNHHQHHYKKKRTLGLQTLCGKNGVSALFELCSKRNWPPPKFVSLSSTPHHTNANANPTSNVGNNSNSSNNSANINDRKANPNALKLSITTSDTDSIAMNPVTISDSNQNDKNKNNNDGKNHSASADDVPKHDANNGNNNNNNTNGDNTGTNVGYCSSSTPTTTATISTTCCMDKIIAVYIKGQELGKGRGGSKKSAQQDAARKALSALYPGVVFDANGYLLDLGTGATDEEVDNDDDAHLFAGMKRNGRQRYNCTTGVEDLAPNLASRLAIDCGADPINGRNGRGSPTPSEDSSISTTVSMKKNIITPMVTGGPFKLNGSVSSGGGRMRTSNIYPCASTTSVSSATSEDDDEYFASSRGAAVCSVLLHAMAQIDERIREPPSYTYDVCSTTMASQQQQQQDGKSSSKRKGGGTGGGAIASKRRSATTEVGRVVTIHRCSFACTASLVLYIQENQTKKDQDAQRTSEHKNISQNEPVKRKDDKGPNRIVTKESNAGGEEKGNKKAVETEAKDRLISQKIHDDDIRPKDNESMKDKERKRNGNESEESKESLTKCEKKEVPNTFDNEKTQDDEEAASINSKSGKEVEGKADTNQEEKKEKVGSLILKKASKEEEVTKKLEAIATGASKRDAKHIASAKLLALLFPDCKGMVEVVKAAEAAREQYAANKALKQSMKATTHAYTKRKKMKCSTDPDEEEKTKSESKAIQSSLGLDRNKNDSPKPLQSVKEEESEDNEGHENDSIDQLYHKRLKLK